MSANLSKTSRHVLMLMICRWVILVGYPRDDEIHVRWITVWWDTGVEMRREYCRKKRYSLALFRV